MGKYLDELEFKSEAEIIAKPLEEPIEIAPRLSFEIPRQHYFIGEQKKIVKKQAEDELVRLQSELEITRKEFEEMPVRIAPKIMEDLILPGAKRLRWELYKILGKEELESRASRKENLRSKIHDYELAAETHQRFLDNIEEPPEFFDEVRRGVEEVLRDPVKLIPFYGSVKSVEEVYEVISAAEKLEKDLPISDYEEGLIERYKAMNLPIPSSVGYGVGTLLASMPTYIAEWGGLKTLVAEPVKRIVGEKVGTEVLGRVVSQTISMLAHGISNVPEIAERTALNLIPNYEELKSPIYQELYGDLGEEVSFKKAFSRAVGSTAVDYITEYAGVLIEKPTSFVSEAIFGKWVAKLGLTETAATISSLAKKVGWDGIIAEVFEEELAELLQAPIEEREYYAPFVTPEGTERLFTEILGIAAFGGIAGVSLATVNQVHRLRIKPELELPMELPKPEEFYQIPKETPPVPDISTLKDTAQKAAQQGNIKELSNTTKEWIETVPDIKPYALWEEEKKQAAYLKLFTTGVPSSKLGKLKQLGKEFVRSGFALVEPMGRWGKELVASAKEIEQSSRQTSAMQLKDLQRAGIEKLTHDEKLSVVATIEDLPKVPVRNEIVDKMVEADKAINDVIGPTAEEMNVMVRNSEGDFFTFVARDNYYSRWVRPQQLINNPKYAKRVIEDSVKVGIFETKKEAQDYYDAYVSFYKTQGKDTTFVNKFAKDNKLSFSKAEGVLSKYILPYTPKRMGKLEKAREYNFRLYDMDYTRVMSEFLPSVWRRMNEIKYWGQNYEGADALTALIGQEGYDGLLAKMVFDTATNRGATIDIRTGLLRDGEQAVLEIQTLKLALSQIMQVVQGANHTALVAWKGSLEGLSKAFTEQGKDFADEVGLIYLKSYEQALAEVGEEGFGSKVLKKTGFTLLDRFVRRWAINSAPFLLKDAIKNIDQPYYRKILGDFLVSKERVKSVLDRGYATEEELKFFSGNLERVTNFLYKRGWDLPPRWEHIRKIPLFKTQLQFKSFQVQQSEFVMKYIVDTLILQPEKGLTNLFNWLLFTTITGASIETIRRVIRGRKLPEDFLGYLEMGLQTGMLGIFIDMVESASYYGGFTRWLAGPFFGDIGEFMYDVSNTKFRKTFDVALPYLLRTLPLTPEQISILNLLYQPVRKRLITPSQEGRPSLRGGGRF